MKLKPIVVNPVNPVGVNEALTKIRAESGLYQEGLMSHFGLACMLVDYTLHIGVDAEYSDCSLEKFLTTIANAPFVSGDAGYHVPFNKKILIGHRNLEKVFLVVIDDEGIVRVIYNVTPMDSEKEDFLLEVMRFEIKINGSRTPPEQLYRLEPTDKDDVGILINVTGLDVYEEDDYVVAVPKYHPNTIIQGHRLQWMNGMSVRQVHEEITKGRSIQLAVDFFIEAYRRSDIRNLDMLAVLNQPAEIWGADLNAVRAWTDGFIKS